MIGQQAADLPLKLLVSRRRFVNSDQSRLIAYLLDENRVFREHAVSANSADAIPA
jgi:hypothetical protein